MVELIRLLRFLPNFGEKKVVRYGKRCLYFLIRMGLVPDQAHLVRMHEVESICQEHLLVFELYPDEGINQLVSPLVHYLEARPQLSVEDPKEDEPAFRKLTDLDVSNVSIAHSVVL